MEKYAFISYAHKDKKEVFNSIKALSSCGINLWYDQGIEVGSDWADKIANKLENSAVLILFLSKNSAKSKNVLREIEYANAHQIPIITVQLYKFKLPEHMEKLLTVNQFTMLSGYKTYKTFANSICPILEKFDVLGMDKCDYKDKKIHITRHRTANKVFQIIILLILAFICFKKIFIAKIPTVIGMESNPAQTNITDSGFDPALANGYCDDEEYGYIFDQNKTGQGLKNSTVVIFQSLGPETDLVTVPDMVGYHISEGVAKLVAVGMKTFVIEPIETKDYEIAYIAAQSIEANYKVSSKNKICLSVSSEPDTVIEFYGQKIQLTEKKLEVHITDNNEVIITPQVVYGISADYTETDPLNESGSISATSRFLISVKREDTNYFGKYRGRFVMETRLQGDDSLAWKILRKTLGDKNGNLSINIASESLACSAEPYDDAKYKHFVNEVTGSSLNAISYQDPIIMILGRDIVLTKMNPLAKNIEWLYSIVDKFVFAIPKLENDVLIQPYSIIVQKNGKAYVSFYGRDGEQKVMKFHGNIQYE